MLQTPVTFFNDRMVSHHFKGPGSVVRVFTRIKDSSVKCPLSVGTEHTGVIKCSHSQNSKGLKSTDCWPAPREQSVCGHKFAWIFLPSFGEANPNLKFLQALQIHSVYIQTTNDAAGSIWRAVGWVDTRGKNCYELAMQQFHSECHTHSGASSILTTLQRNKQAFKCNSIGL
jgi:hypothetical protein